MVLQNIGKEFCGGFLVEPMPIIIFFVVIFLLTVAF
jgi:hypothetical protein